MNKNLIEKQILKGQNIVAPVESSHISTVAYNPSTKVLTILFKKGQTYTYKDVSTGVALELFNAKSIGKAFWNLVRGEKDYKKLSNVQIVGV